MLILILFLIAYSTVLYLFLHYKTHMQIKLLLVDNIIVILGASLVLILMPMDVIHKYLLTLLLIPFFVFVNIHIRFWRSPKRDVSSDPRDIVSPADGRIIYINRLEYDRRLEANKRGSVSQLKEIAKTELTPSPCWQIGINMTPFDVHKNCSPIDGSILFSKHFAGRFLSLKDTKAVSENERHTYVIENESSRVAVVQIASKRVRRIEAYVNEGDSVKKGSWLGMIRFGSQVDVFIPINSDLSVEVGQQVYAGSVVLATHQGLLQDVK